MGELFNKGLDAGKKQERKAKNIEGKNEQRLDLIREQRDKQLNLISKIKSEKINPFDFYE